MSHGPSDASRCEPNLIPLLDLVMQLIMFFLVTVNFIRVDQFNEDIKLPPAQAATVMDRSAQDWVFLNLDKDGHLAGTNVQGLNTPEKLKAHLQRERDALEREYRAKGKTGDIKVVVVLRADGRCRYKDVYEVLDSCTKAGYRRWQLRVKKEAETPQKATS